MGSSWSSTFSTQSNADTKQILNTILKRLITEVDMHDMYSLADPKMCKEYIVMATSTLDKFFATIRIDKKEDGTLLFQKIKGLQDRNPDPQLQQQRCKELAFYFIRIFQVYAAISLSIMDSELPAADPTEILKPKEQRRRGVFTIKSGDLVKAPPTAFSSRGWFGRGGRLDPTQDGPTSGNFYLPDSVGPYQLLNHFLVPPQNREGKNALAFKTSSGAILSMAMPQDSLYNFDGGARQPKDLNAQPPKVNYMMIQSGSRLIMTADLRMTEDGSKTTIDLENIQIEGKGSGGGVKRVLNDFLGDKNPKADNGSELPTVLQEMFKESYNRVVPLTFSAVEFLYENNLIRSMDGVVAIEGTNLSIINPRDQKGESVRVTYKKKHRMDNQTRNVEILTNLIVDKRKKTDIEAQKYFVKVDFGAIETKPEDLRDDLNMPVYETREGASFRGKERYFTTGLSGSSRPVSDKGETVPVFLETVFKDLLLEKDELEKRNGIKYTREGLPQPYNSDQIPPTMRIKELWKALAKDPPIKAHCVARAMQLLNLTAIRGTETKDAFSSICRIRFPYSKDGTLPPPGQPITEEYGVLSLAMLFVDKLVGSSPQITESEQYKEFRRKFKFFFERYEESKLDDVQAPEKLSDIDEKIMPGLCTGHTKDRILLESDTVYQLQAKAKALIDRQASHVRNCMAILFKLFDEKAVRSGKFEISTYVYQEGTEAINQIAEETRNMLVEYYGDCEETYKEGVYILYNKYKANPESIKYSRVDSDT